MVHKVNCYVCLNEIYLPDAHYEAARAGREAISFYCTYGHPQVFTKGDTAEDKLRRERDLYKQQLAQKDSEIECLLANQRQLSREKRLVQLENTSLKKRAAAGVCPCCSRQFQNMERHMKTKHPEFKAEAAE